MIHNLHGPHASSEYVDAQAKKIGSQRIVRVGFDQFVGACHVYAYYSHRTATAPGPGAVFSIFSFRTRSHEFRA